MTFREEITAKRTVPDSINQIVLHEICKMDFVVLLIGSLTSFVEKDKPTGGLNVGDIAPDFKIQSMSAGQPLAELSDMKGKYVLLSFGQVMTRTPGCKTRV